MLRCDQFVTGHAAPRRNVGAGSRIVCGEGQHLTGPHRFQALPELEHEVAAPEVARIPPGIHASLRSPFFS